MGVNSSSEILGGEAFFRSDSGEGIVSSSEMLVRGGLTDPNISTSNGGATTWPNSMRSCCGEVRGGLADPNISTKTGGATTGPNSVRSCCGEVGGGLTDPNIPNNNGGATT